MTMATPTTLGLDPLPEGVDITITPPPDVEWHTVDGVFIKQMYIRNAGTFIPQHSHQWDHASMLAKGSVFVWKDGKLDDRYRAPAMIYIEKGVKHTFMALEDDTMLYCVHNLHGAAAVCVLEEHGITEDAA